MGGRVQSSVRNVFLRSHFAQSEYIPVESIAGARNYLFTSHSSLLCSPLRSLAISFVARGRTEQAENDMAAIAERVFPFRRAVSRRLLEFRACGCAWLYFLLHISLHEST